MKECGQLESYLDGALTGAKRASFLTHATQCPACASEAAAWHAIEERVRAWGQEGLPTPTPEKVRRLVRRAQERHRPPPWRPSWAYVFLGVGGLAALLAVITWREPPHAPQPPGVAQLPMRLQDADLPPVPEEEVAGATLQALAHEPLRVQLGRDRLGVLAGGRARVLRKTEQEVRIRLEVGAIAAQVEPRHGQGAFVVEAADVEVRVVGTRFSVHRPGPDRVIVSVVQGKVRAGQGSQAWEVGAGQRLELSPAGGTLGRALANELSEMDAALDDPEDAELSESTPVPPRKTTRAQPPDLASWRRQVVEGRYDEVERAIRAHLRRHPRDAEAWSLLADSQRKQGDYPAAVATSRKIVTLGDRAAANRARYLAASILQEKLGDHAAAATLLRLYLRQDSGPTPLAAAAMVRLARSLAALGQHAEAEGLLHEVIRKYDGTPAANEARQRLAPSR